MNVNPQIVRGIRLGNQADFKVLYELFSRKIFSVSVRFGLSHEEASEVVQDVFVKVWQYRHTLDENLSVNAYLFTITKNLLITRQKKQAYEIAYKKYLEKQDISSLLDTENVVVYSELEALTQSIIRKLPAQQREIFLLSKSKNLSHKEIADKLNVSLRTVENQVYRATKKIKDALKKHDVIIGLLLCWTLR